MEIEVVDQTDGMKQVLLTGNLSFKHTDQLKRVINDLIANHQNLKEVVIDVSRLNSIDSSGIGSLIYLYMHLKQEGIISLIATGTDTDSYINKCFKDTHLNKVLTFITSLSSPQTKITEIDL